MPDTVMTDELTGLLSYQGFLFLGQYAFSEANRRVETLSVVAIGLEHLERINDSFGHQQGDLARIAFANLMKSSFRETDLIARQGSDEFVLLFNATSEEGAYIAMLHLQGEVAKFNQRAENPWTLAFRWGSVEYDPGRHSGLDEVIAEADKARHQAKPVATDPE